jgi:hypothetical protein
VKHWSFIQEVFLQKGCVEEGRHFFTQIQRYFMRVLYGNNLMYFGKFLDRKEERKKRKKLPSFSNREIQTTTFSRQRRRLTSRGECERRFGMVHIFFKLY